jgi:opacity protein-like surface antigen
MTLSELEVTRLMAPLPKSAPILPALAALTLALKVLCPVSASAGEIELKSLNTVQNDPATKRNYGPYVGVFGGANNSQFGKVRIGGFNYSLDDHDNSTFFGIEVGKTWRSKKFPLAFSLDFEGSFMRTELSGELDPEVRSRERGTVAPPASTNPLLAPTVPSTPALPTDSTLDAYTADMSTVIFMVNGTLSLDLWRYRARVGKFIGGLKPYIGGGFGGGQVWFRNSFTRSLAQADDPSSATLADTTPFAIDEFVSAWQWYCGIEYSWEDKYSLFAEYREFHFGEFEDMTDFYTKGYAIGFRYRY